MKTVKIKYALLAAAIVPFLMGCPKAKPRMAPEADKELQSSIDASFANFVVTDIDMICGFLSQTDRNPVFYMNVPGVVTPSLEADPEYDKCVIAYNSTQCADGTMRDGSIFFHRKNILEKPNAKYYHNYEFSGYADLKSFKVGDWAIKVKDGTELTFRNNLSSSVYNPSQTKLSWIIEGSLEFQHRTDPSRNMTWNGKLTKTLTNSANPSVFDAFRIKAINWSLANVEYVGTVTGVTSGNVPYTMTINSERPLIRDFGCTPSPVGGVESIQPFKAWKEEFHPFKSGIVSFTTGERYPREIYYGNEGNPELSLQCDNSGQVLIKGVAYEVDFIK